jgi:hypothetical protein
MSEHRTYKPRKPDQSCHAIYQGDTFIDLGTLEELSEKLNISKKNLQWYKTPAAKKRISGERNGYIVIKIEDDEGDEYEC